MSGPWEKYKKAEPAADGPWAKYKQPEAAAPVEESMNPFAGASVGENLSAAYDTAKSLGGDLMDRVGSLTEAANPLTPLARVAGNAVGAALDPEKDYDQYVADDEAARAARAERTPGVYGLAGTLSNPVNKLAGLPGMAASVGVNAANSELEALVLDSRQGQQDIAQNAGMETAVGTAANLLPKALAPAVKAVAGKAGSMADDLAQYFGKRSLGGTKGQLQKLDIESDALGESVRALREQGVYDKPIQGAEKLYDTISSKRKDIGAEANRYFEANAAPANQAEVYQQLMTRAKIARNRGQAEIANKLESEANIIKGIDSTPLGIDQPIVADADQLKQIDMQNTELDPSIIKERKTSLDNDAYKSKVETNKTAEAAGDEMRDIQYGLVDGDQANTLRDMNKNYGQFKTAEKLAAAKAAGEATNGGGLISNIRRTGIGSVALATGNPIVAGLAVAGDMLLSKYGNQLGTYGFNKSSKILQNQNWSKQLLDAAERGGAAGVGSTHYLLTQRDPEYRKAHQEDQEASKE